MRSLEQQSLMVAANRTNNKECKSTKRKSAKSGRSLRNDLSDKRNNQKTCHSSVALSIRASTLTGDPRGHQKCIASHYGTVLQPPLAHNDVMQKPE